MAGGTKEDGVLQEPGGSWHPKDWPWELDPQRRYYSGESGEKPWLLPSTSQLPLEYSMGGTSH